MPNFFERVIPGLNEIAPLAQSLMRDVLPEDQEQINQVEDNADNNRENLLISIFQNRWRNGVSVIESLYAEVNEQGIPALEFDLTQIIMQLIECGLDQINYLLPNRFLQIMMNQIVHMPEFRSAVSQFDPHLFPEELIQTPQLLFDILGRMIREGMNISRVVERVVPGMEETMREEQ